MHLSPLLMNLISFRKHLYPFREHLKRLQLSKLALLCADGEEHYRFGEEEGGVRSLPVRDAAGYFSFPPGFHLAHLPRNVPIPANIS
jgi:hypothetical protein